MNELVGMKLIHSMNENFWEHRIGWWCFANLCRHRPFTCHRCELQYCVSLVLSQWCNAFPRSIPFRSIFSQLLGKTTGSGHVSHDVTKQIQLITGSYNLMLRGCLGRPASCLFDLHLWYHYPGLRWAALFQMSLSRTEIVLGEVMQRRFAA